MLLNKVPHSSIALCIRCTETLLGKLPLEAELLVLRVGFLAACKAWKTSFAVGRSSGWACRHWSIKSLIAWGQSSGTLRGLHKAQISSAMLQGNTSSFSMDTSWVLIPGLTRDFSESPGAEGIVRSDIRAWGMLLESSYCRQYAQGLCRKQLSCILEKERGSVEWAAWATMHWLIAWIERSMMIPLGQVPNGWSALD